MKQTVANSRCIFVDRPLTKRTVARVTPSLWSLSKDDTDFTDAALRMFLMLCLIASLVLGGLKINGGPKLNVSARYELSVGKILSRPAMPTVSLGVSIR